MLVFRIVHKKYTALVPSGLEGRWNSGGNKVIYTAESIPLAFLESMIRRQGVGFADHFKILFIDVPNKPGIEEVSPQDLAADWRTNDSACRLLGDKWYKEERAMVLKVPSAVLPFSYNYVLNLQHPSSSKLKVIAVTDLMPDPRIEEILKKYK